MAEFIEERLSAIAGVAKIVDQSMDLVDSGGLANGAVSLLSKVAGLFGFATGTDYVPRDMLAVVHQGEKIIPAAQNRGQSGQVNHITINLSGAGGSAADMRRSSGQIAREVAAAIKGTARYA